MALKSKKGFTMVEMMVVLGIIAILSLISVGALIANSNYQRLNKSAEEIVSMLREGQNRSVSIIKNNGNDTKAWEFGINGASGNYALKSLDASGSGLAESATSSSNDQGTLPEGTIVSVNYYQGSSTTASQSNLANFYAMFTTPFARTYISSSNSISGASAACIWNDGSSPATPRMAKDWYIDTGCSTTYSPGSPGYATIALDYKNNTITITVNSNGDVSYQ